MFVVQWVYYKTCEISNTSGVSINEHESRESTE